ncbi:AraC family transcriptional regulator [Micromonospora sp. CPCC 205371]|nr:AraC family transcriptional regulator [Micromonospora sp. CPCC 205371]
MSFQTSDVDETRAFCREFFHPLTLDVTSGGDGFTFDITATRLGPMTIGDIGFGAETSLACEYRSAYQLNMPLAGRLDGEHSGQPFSASPGRGSLYNPEGPVRLPRLGADLRVMVVKIDTAALVAELESLLGHAIRGPLRPAPDIDFATGPGRSLARLLALVRAEMDNPDGLITQPLLAGRLSHSVLTGLLMATDHPYREELSRPAPPARPRSVQHVVDAIEATPDVPFTVRDLANMAGVSVRSLQEGFREYVGMPPMAYLRRVRLERVHADMSAANGRSETVASVAHRWGFTHLGRFAQAYRAVYGDLPAQTLRRRTG